MELAIANAIERAVKSIIIHNENLLFTVNAIPMHCFSYQITEIM